MQFLESVKSLEVFYEDLESKVKKVKKELSDVDKDVNSLYHLLEYGKNDAVSLVKIAKKLTDSLRLRRSLKEDHIALQGISSMLPSYNKITQKTRAINNNKEQRENKYEQLTACYTLKFKENS